MLALLRLSFFLLPSILILTGCSDKDDSSGRTRPISCDGMAGDGTILVPEECADLSAAADAAGEVPGTTIVLAAGSYNLQDLWLTNQTRLQAQDPDNRPEVVVTDDVVVENASIASVFFETNLLELENAEISESSFIVTARNGITLYGALTLTGIALEGGFQAQEITALVMENSRVSGDGLGVAGSAIIHTSELDSLGVASSLELENSVVTGTLFVYPDESSFQGTIWDSTLGQLEASSTDQSINLSLQRVRIHSLGEEAIVLHGTNADAYLSLEMYNSVITSDQDVLRVDGGDTDSIAQGRHIVRLFNNVFVGGRLFALQAADCNGYAHEFELTMHNNIFVDVELELGLTTSLSYVNTEYNLYWQSVCNCATTESSGNCNVGATHNLGLLTEEGCLTVDPLFVDLNRTEPAASDLTLQAESPAIDVGAPGQAYNDDDGSRNDLGIYGGPKATPR